MYIQSPWVEINAENIEIIKTHKSICKKYAAGDSIFYLGDHITHLHFLLKGRVKISVSDAKGQEKTLAIHEAGSFFGETSFFDKNPSLSFAQAVLDSQVLIFERGEVDNIIARQPAIATLLLESLAQKIRLLTFQVEYLSFMSVEQQVVAMLSALFDSFGKKAAGCGGLWLSVQVTDNELGQMLGVRREAVTKALNKLKKAGIIEKEKRVIYCMDLERLRRYQDEAAE